MKKLYIGLYIWIVAYILVSLWLNNYIENYSMLDSQSLREIAKIYLAAEKNKTAVNPQDIEKISTNLTLFKTEKEAKKYRDKNNSQFSGAYLTLSSNDKKDEVHIVLDNPLVKKLLVKSPLVCFLISPGFYLITIMIVVIIWLLPLYSYNFRPSKVHKLEKIGRRITNLPFFILVISFFMAVFTLCLKLYFYKLIFGILPLRIVFLFAMTSTIFVTFMAIGVVGGLQKYIQDNIASKFFKETNPFGKKMGVAFSMTIRVALTILLLGSVPIFLLIYLPLSFNSYLITSKDIRLAILQNISYAIPLILSIGLAIWFMIAQIISIFTFRKSIQNPINSLIDRMEMVKNGDFDCKTVVLHNDEIGQLKAHFNEMLDGLVEREQIKDTFGRFVSYEIAEKLMNSGELKLSGELINATILFSDIRNFTPLSETMDPESLINFLNHYFSFMVQPIQNYGGVVNKFIGDAIMAIFTPSFSASDPSNSALKAALEMREALKEFNNLKSYPPIGTGIGIHCGSLVAGNVGTQNRMEYTVIGDNVNIAARIESQTKVFKTDLLISNNVLEQIDRDFFAEHEFISCPSVTMKGKSKPMTLFKIEKNRIKN